MKVVIMGCGRSGAALALQLSARGHDVTIIDTRPESLRRLGSRYVCRTMVGSGLDLDTLVKAGVDGCDAFFAMTRGDNTNLMAAQIVQRNFGVGKVCAKVADPLRAEAYRELGLFTINAAALLAGICRDWLLGEEFGSIDTYNSVTEEMEL